MDAPASAPTAAETGAPRPVEARNRRLLVLLTLGAMCMVGFGFAAVPFYYLLCKATGTQLRPNSQAAIAASGTHTGRFVEVFFECKIFDGLPLWFAPEERAQKLEVGIDGTNVYHFQNRSKESVHFRPVHTVSPDIGNDFGMKVCFCFTDQVLGPGESRDFTVVYTLAPSLDPRVDAVTVCYSLNRVEDGEDADTVRARIQSRTGPDQRIMTPGLRREDTPAPAPVEGKGKP